MLESVSKADLQIVGCPFRYFDLSGRTLSGALAHVIVGDKLVPALT
jgi:hypothetical protein